MAELVTLHAVNMRTHGWKKFVEMHFAAGDCCAPLLIAELAVALPLYPLAFVQKPGGGGFLLVVLQGLFQGENLFVDHNGKWQAGYIPSCYRAYPFALSVVAVNGERREVLCFDRASGLYREFPNPASGEERFFDDNGQLGPLLQHLLGFLNQTSLNRRKTDSAVAALEKANLLEPWPLPLADSGPARQALQGVYKINESALNALSGTTLEELRNSGALAIAYAQLFSQPRLGVLQHLHSSRRAAQMAAPPATSLDLLFGEGQDDIIRF